jgi:heptaprenylglyceryl phosphate synthase
LVGGGIRSVDAVRTARDAGADLVVVGGALEEGGTRVVRDLAMAARA